MQNQLADADTCELIEKLTAHAVRALAVKGDSFAAAGQTHSLSDKASLLLNGFDVAPDEKRAIVVMPASGTSAPDRQRHVTFLLNFADEVQGLRWQQPANVVLPRYPGPINAGVRAAWNTTGETSKIATATTVAQNNKSRGRRDDM